MTKTLYFQRKRERVDTCLLAHTFPLAFPLPSLLLLPPSSLTRARTRTFSSTSPILPLPLRALPSHSLHPHRPSSRRGRAAVVRVRAAIIAISSLSSGGASSPPRHPPLHPAIIHPPTTNTTTMSPPSYPHYFHSFCTYHRVSFGVV